MVTSGLEQATPALQEARLAMCRACEFHREDGRCGGTEGCGCFVAIKARFAAAACPLGHWPDR